MKKIILQGTLRIFIYSAQNATMHGIYFRLTKNIKNFMSIFTILYLILKKFNTNRSFLNKILQFETSTNEIIFYENTSGSYRFKTQFSTLQS